MSAVVATAEDVAVLTARIEQLEQLVRQLAVNPAAPKRSFLTPNEVRARYGVGRGVVYSAIASGRLIATQRPLRRGGQCWAVAPADAEVWFATFIAKGSNQ